jgi:hypothetical protein
MPELKLTLRQAVRMWNLTAELCEVALAALVATGFLIQTHDDSYVRRGSLPRSVVTLDALTWHIGPSCGAAPRPENM